ncbi:hypothetical protein BKG71_05280 [Mycobacteroides chelonae]|nr:hypothetical protein BKG63_12800 [Mycobacteroides chelonae]OHT94611.1 hypothetical protein BKG72_20890 [Mycobacteroides chelonae]OHU02809.1 hypothetical protein BKG71_05280 [Mycobacteroides chelonae]OHU74687.1 hypothetical protein BKG87_05390 [Mycobacteroides chelonae]OLT79880.1 hypothetical protein BKG57_07175 [Mycobacteroides chelonae]
MINALIFLREIRGNHLILVCKIFFNLQEGVSIASQKRKWQILHPDVFSKHDQLKRRHATDTSEITI